MQFQVHNRFTGAVQFTAEIDCDESAPRSIKLGLAVRWGLKARADLAGANLAGANLARADLTGANLARADLARADLAHANLACANLTGAYLAGADLTGAYLERANLAHANLTGAYLAHANLGGSRIYVDGGLDRRGYHFLALGSADDLTIRAGCRRWGSFDAARAHYGEIYESDGDVAECLARLDLIEAQFKARAAKTAEAA